MAEEKVSGKPVTDAQIQAWADEAEAGYSVDRLRRRGRKPLGEGPSDVVPVRMDAELLQALAERAEREHVTRSEAIRAAAANTVFVGDLDEDSPARQLRLGSDDAGRPLE